MNIKDAQKCLDLVLNEQASLAGQYPDGDYYSEFAVICNKYDIDPEIHWENVLDSLDNPNVRKYDWRKEEWLILKRNILQIKSLHQTNIRFM